MPSLSNSPLIRSVPHDLFSRDRVRISSCTSGLRCGRPPREQDFQRQNRRQPCRCHRTTVSGVTIPRCSRQRAHQRRASTHSSLSQLRSRARGRVRVGRVRTASWWPQEQVLGHEIAARACPGQNGREQQPDEFEHVSKITDRRSRKVLPSYSSSSDVPHVAHFDVTTDRGGGDPNTLTAHRASSGSARKASTTLRTRHQVCAAQDETSHYMTGVFVGGEICGGMSYVPLSQGALMAAKPCAISPLNHGHCHDRSSSQVRERRPVATPRGDIDRRQYRPPRCADTPKRRLDSQRRTTCELPDSCA
jgi:hypothetical protein